MISLAPQRQTCAVIQESGIFNINILSNEQTGLARHFGLISGHTTNKFERCLYTDGKNRAPVLPELKAIAECNLLSTYAVGDHHLLIGEITYFHEDNTRSPLRFSGADYW